VSREKLSVEKLAFGGLGIIIFKMKWSSFVAVVEARFPAAVTELLR